MNTPNNTVKTLESNRPLRRPGAFLPLLLIIMSSYPPLSTDMYLPSFPDIVSAFGADESTVNLTLVLFFVFFAFSTLLWGPISDKFGRKKPLMTGILLYSIASVGCMWAPTIHLMIFWRILQALGAGAPVTISIAIVQDTYSGEEKTRILAILGALMMIAPVVAPTAGTTILMFGQWRIIFAVLALLGVFSLIGCCFIQESIPKRTGRTILRSFGSLFVVLKSGIFRKALLILSLPAIYILGFVGGSAMIFMSEFSQPRTAFAIFFAVNAVFAILGSALYVPLNRRFSTLAITMVSFLAIAASGVLIVCIGRMSATIFLICVLPGTAASALLRPLSVDFLMDAGGPDTGAASSIINFSATLIGSIGMQAIAFEWGSRVLFYGALAAVVGLVGLAAWPRIYQSGQSKPDTDARTGYAGG